MLEFGLIHQHIGNGVSLLLVVFVVLLAGLPILLEKKRLGVTLQKLMLAMSDCNFP